MKYLYSVLMMLVVASFIFLSACSQITQEIPVDEKNGWVSLFNGKDLDNWDLKLRNGDPIEAKQVFSVENNMVHVFAHHPDKYQLNVGAGTHGLMYTKKKYSQYIFRFQYKWGSKIMNNFDRFQYDAGMYYHVYNDKVWPFGIEYQVRYDHTKNKNHTGDYWATNVEINWFSDTEGKQFVAPKDGGIKQLIKKGEHLASTPKNVNALNNQWNTVEVIVMGDKYSIHKLNGEVVNYAVDFDFGEGIIGLQSETAEIYYRNIEIKEFSNFIPASVFLNQPADMKL